MDEHGGKQAEDEEKRPGQLSAEDKALLELEGVMEKRSPMKTAYTKVGIKKWQSRFCRIHEGKLRYFKASHTRSADAARSPARPRPERDRGGPGGARCRASPVSRRGLASP